MKNAELAHALSVLDWGLFETDFRFSDNHTLRRAEPVLHEVCHAVALGLQVNKKAPDRVSEFFEDLNNRSKVMGVANEVHAFAIERHALEQLGWLRYFRFTALMKDVHENGLSGPSMPSRLFFSLYRAIVREPRTRAMADIAISEAYEVANRRRRWR